MADRQFRVAQSDEPTVGKFTPTVLLVDDEGDPIELGLDGTAPTIANAATFADLTAATTAYNALLAALRTRGVLAS